MKGQHRDQRMRMPALIALALLLCACPPQPDFRDAYAWSFDFGQALVSSPVANADGDPVAAAYEGRVACVDSETGKLLWSIALHDTIVNPPVIDSDGAIYVGSGTGRLYRIDASGEKAALSWSYLPPSRTTTEPILLGSDGVLIPNGVYAEAVLVDKASGAERARISLPPISESHGGFGYNTSYNRFFTIGSGDFRYALSGGNGSFDLLREDGSVAARLALPTEIFKEGEYMVEEGTGDPGPRIFTTGAYASANGLEAVGFRQYWDGDALAARNRLLRLSIGLSGITVLAELEDDPDDFGMYPGRVDFLPGNIISAYYYGRFVQWEADTGALHAVKSPLADMFGVENASYAYEQAFYGPGGRIAFWYGQSSTNNPFKSNRYLYIHHPDIPDPGRHPVVEVPAKPILASPLLSGNSLFICSTEGFLQAYPMEGWSE